MTVDGIRNSEDKKQTNSLALKIHIPCNFLNHLELKQDSERQIHSQISKFCKLSFDRSFLGRTCRVWWNCLSVIGLMPKLPPSSILRGPSDCPNAALWPGSHPSPVPPSSTWFPTKVDDPRFILPDMASPARTHSFGDDGLTLGFHILCLFKSSLGSPGASLAMCRPQSTATRKLL